MFILSLSLLFFFYFLDHLYTLLSISSLAMHSFVIVLLFMLEIATCVHDLLWLIYYFIISSDGIQLKVLCCNAFMPYVL